MRTPIILSVLFHGSVLTFAAMDIPFFDNDEDRPMEIIPVEIVDIAELTKVRELVKTPVPDKDKTEPPKLPERVVEMPPVPPKMASTMPLENVAVENPAAKPKPKPPVKRAVMPSASPRSRPRPPSRFSSDRIAALLNKVEDKRTATEKLAEKYAPKEQQMTSLDIRRQTMSISAAIQKKIQDQCWNPPSGALDAGKLRVTVNFNLSPDGNIVGQPKAEDYARMNGPLKVAADSALRAVRMCAPYSDLKLPKDMYDQWREIKMNFDPTDMIS